MRLFFLPLLARAASPWANYTILAKEIAATMNLSSRISLLHGHSIFDFPYVGNVPAYSGGSPNTSLPPLHLEDGPQGVADAMSFVTCFPSAGTVLQSWDESLFFAFGAAMAAEQHAKGVNVVLAPAVNLVRVPWSGRTWEFLGEDPFLAASMARSEVLGIQTNTNVTACVKHLALNSQEFERNSVSETASRRVLWEMYYAPFVAAVDAGVGSAMCSYNRLNKTYACEDATTLSDLKSRMGFQGWVMSDWYATHSALGSALAGLDQEMPGGFYFSDALSAAVQSGSLPSARFADMVERVITPILALGLARDPPTASRNIFTNATTASHNALARTLAEASIVLLRNEKSLLPIDVKNATSWAIFGDEGTVVGQGSGGVNLPYLVTPQQGIAAAVNAAGVDAPVLYLDGRNASAAAMLARKSSVVVVVVGITSSEGTDRVDLSLPSWQNELVAAVVASNPRTIVVVRSPGACLMPWRDSVPAILFELMPGQESGNSIASTILGANNPSGKTTITFPNSMNETWLGDNSSRYPGVDRGLGFLEVDYGEELLMGYRWYDAMGIEPLFPFGHGLSYSSFAYSNLAIKGILSSNPDSVCNVSFSIDLQPGSPPGTEVAQLYIEFPNGLGEPPRVLKGFAKVSLTPGVTAHVSIQLKGKDMFMWDENTDAWRSQAGLYYAVVGSSSRDLRLRGPFDIIG